MNIAQLEAMLAYKNVPFVHFAPDQARVHIARLAFFAAMLDTPDYNAVITARYRFIVCEPAGAGCEHVPVVIIEDEQDIAPAVLQEALLVAAPTEYECQPMVIRVKSEW